MSSSKISQCKQLLSGERRRGQSREYSEKDKGNILRPPNENNILTTLDNWKHYHSNAWQMANVSIDWCHEKYVLLCLKNPSDQL